VVGENGNNVYQQRVRVILKKKTNVITKRGSVD
jgi:hypothetical protein